MRYNIEKRRDSERLSGTLVKIRLSWSFCHGFTHPELCAAGGTHLVLPNSLFTSLTKHQEEMCGGLSPLTLCFNIFKSQNRETINKPMCFVLVLFMVSSSCSSRHSHRNMFGTWLKFNMIFQDFYENEIKGVLQLTCLCVTRIFAGPQPVIHWVWLMLEPCVTRRGAAPSLKMMACPPLSQLPMNLVRKLFVFAVRNIHHQGLHTHIMHVRFMLMHKSCI